MKTPRITQPLHTYSGPELENLKAGFEAAENAPGVAILNQELAIRQDEFEQRQSRKPRKRKTYLNAA